jgi:hypothetical protein
MSALAWTSNAQFLYPYLRSCALHRDTEIVALFQNINEAGPLLLTGARVERAA